MLNSDRFITSFNKIAHHLRKITKKGKSTSFYKLVDIASNSNPIVRRLKDDLKEFADLRNAIVHERTNSHVIAEPNDRTVNEIETFVSFLLDPPKVIPMFQKEVLTLPVNDSIAKAVKSMFDQSFSQIPIYDGQDFMGLLTTNTIVRWLGSCVKDDIFSLTETSISNVLHYTEDKDNHNFLNRETSIFKVIEMFQDYEKSGKKLEAILITQNGLSTEALLGIITIWDLPNIHKNLQKF